MSRKIQTFVFLVLLITFCCEASPSFSQTANASTTAGVDGDYIRVNQIGYLSSETKVAIAFSNTSLSTQTFSIINNVGGAVLYGPMPLVATAAYAPFTYLYNENFTAYQPTSPVTCYVQDSDGTKSVPFVVGPCTYQTTVAAAVNFYRGQNCGTGNQYGGTSPGGTATQADCHMAPGTAGWTTDEDGMVVDGPNAGNTINVEGGLHDSGDWIKFMITAAWVDEGILFAYQNNPTVFQDIYGANMQAGGNGVPDVLDEGRYVLNWIIQMNPNATTFYYDVADGRDHDNFGNLASTDKENYDTTSANEGNGDPYGAVAKPYRTVYGGTNDQGGTNNAARAAGALAMGYQIWSAAGTSFQDTTFANTCLTHAEWLYALAKSENYTQVDVDDFYPVNSLANYADYPEMEMAAVQLYKATGTASYLTDAQNFAPNVGSAGGELDWSANNFMAHLCLYQVAPSAAVSSYMRADLEANLTRYNAAGNPYGVDYPYGWGGMEAQTSSVFMCQEWQRLFPTDTTFTAMGTYNRDWLLGRNPWGCCFIQGLGTVFSLHPQHNIAMAIYPTIITGGAIEGPCDYNSYNSQGNILTGGQDPYGAFDNNKSGGWVYHDDNGDYVSNEMTSTQSMWNLNVLANLAALSTSCSASTPTNSPTNTRTVTFTNTPTKTFTATLTNTTTATLTNTPQSTSTFTYTPTGIPSSTPTQTLTNTYTAVLTNTASATGTSTPSQTATFTKSNTPANTPSATSTLTLSATPTLTPTATVSFTPSNTPLTPVDTSTASMTATSTFSSTVTNSTTATLSNTVTSTVTLTSTETNTLTLTSTPTNTFTKTAVLTNTFTGTATNTMTLTFTFSFTPSATMTNTPTVTSTFSLTVTATNTPTATSSFTRTLTSTSTATQTFTATLTRTMTPTNTPTISGGCAGIPNWNGNFVAYSVGQKVDYNNEVYQCIQAHTSEPSWEPPVVPALWKNWGPCGSTPTTALALSPVIYPNPVTGSTTTLQLATANAVNVKIQIFTLAFREVQTVTASQVEGNTMTVSLIDRSGMPLANGLYYFVIQAGGQKWVNKVLVLR